VAAGLAVGDDGRGEGEGSKATTVHDPRSPMVGILPAPQHPAPSTQHPARKLEADKRRHGMASDGLPRHIGFGHLGQTGRRRRRGVCELGISVARTVKLVLHNSARVSLSAANLWHLRVPEDSVPNQPYGKLVPKIPDTARKRQRHVKTEAGEGFGCR